MKIALGQFAVSKDWQENLQMILHLIDKAMQQEAKLLLLPEAVLAQDIHDPNIALRVAQDFDGPFLQAILAKSQESELAVAFTMPMPSKNKSDGRMCNNLLLLKTGKILASYTKIHLYDAFNSQESKNVCPGDEVAPLIEIDGFKFGLMTCYDLRFPELAAYLVQKGADALLVPAAWFKGPHKEDHWQTLIKARALENTCYVIGVGDCGVRNIGHSMVADPLGVVVVQAAEAPTMLFTELSRERIDNVRRQLPVLKNRRFEIAQLGKGL